MRLSDCELKKNVYDRGKITLTFVISKISDDGFYSSRMKNDNLPPDEVWDILKERMNKAGGLDVSLVIPLDPTMFVTQFEGKLSYTSVEGLGMFLYMNVTFTDNVERLMEKVDKMNKMNFRARLIIRRECFFKRQVLRECEIKIEAK